MLKAIDRCADRGGNSMYVNKVPRHHGLRTIRDFERVNGFAFDPFNEGHVSTIAGMARFNLANHMPRLRNHTKS